jgi:hypothetical protein
MFFLVEFVLLAVCARLSWAGRACCARYGHVDATEGTT